MKNEMAYMREHLPRCLGTYARPACDALRTQLQKELGEDSTAFTPLCECSNNFLIVIASTKFSSTSVSCPKCEASRVVFDPKQHGYDGELGHNTECDLSTPAPVTCSECGGNSHELALCFQYSGETDVLDDDDPPDVKPEDLFGWVMISAKCQNCNAIQVVTQSECA